MKAVEKHELETESTNVDAEAKKKQKDLQQGKQNQPQQGKQANAARPDEKSRQEEHRV